MSNHGDAIAARARALVGVRFRPQGRDPEYGLDCVGVAALATEAPPERVRRDYALRGARLAEMEHELCDMGFLPVPGSITEAGDVIICETGPAQLHVAVLTDRGFVHADAGLRMVVERPAPVPWPIAGIWRTAGDSLWRL